MSGSVRIGHTIDGKYQVIESLGEGGMANVWLARDERLGKLWAIKEIKPNTGGAQKEAMRQAILDEANFMKCLDHPAIPRVVDIHDTGAEVFVVMDYVDGTELGALMRERGRAFAQEDVIGWGIQLCDVLAYLHRRNPPVVYRDMKPSNIILRDDGTVRLIDFGIALECVPGSNGDGRIVGTPGYAPPEQIPDSSMCERSSQSAGGMGIDARADVYALGATMYSLVTGHVPRMAANERGESAVTFRMKPIRAWNPQLSEGLERILTRATQADRTLRYASIEEMRYDLTHYRKMTQEWRDAQQHKVARFRKRVVATVCTAIAGCLCFFFGAALRQSDFESFVRVAHAASATAAGDNMSDAERACMEAIATSPARIEPYARLLEVYEYDFRFSNAEDVRWRKTLSHADGLEKDDGYAKLCFDAGIAYLSYYGLEQAGGSVGNAAIASIDAASPWFDRAVRACGEDLGHNGQRIDETDVQTAKDYGVVASFYKTVSRAGQEGRSASEAYRTFWDAISNALYTQNNALDAERSVEGARVRLCQVAVEALSSNTYLAGFSRAGVTREQADSLLTSVRKCTEGLRDFSQAKEYERVFGPVFEEIEAGQITAQKTIQNVYANPVLALGAKEDEQ